MDRHLKTSFSKFKHIIKDTDKFYNDMMKVYLKNKVNLENPLIGFRISNGRVKLLNPSDDDRVKHILSMLKKTIKYCKENEKKIPNTTMYFWIADRVPWELKNNMEKYPFFVFASPKDINNVIFPDNTFECITLREKYRGECFDWDYIKKMFEKQNKKMRKQKIIYFKGTPTTRKIHRIREILHDYAVDRKDMLISLDAWKKYEPVTNYSKYLFLLNLPGHYPWSNRLKYLFLTNSIVINVKRSH